jgi:hypothetical protein
MEINVYKRIIRAVSQVEKRSQRTRRNTKDTKIFFPPMAGKKARLVSDFFRVFRASVAIPLCSLCKLCVLCDQINSKMIHYG